MHFNHVKFLFFNSFIFIVFGFRKIGFVRLMTGINLNQNSEN